MADDDSSAGNLVKGVLGVGLGFALYMLISGFGGGGFGFGRGGGAPGPAGAGGAPVPAPGRAAGPPERNKIVLTAAGITLDGISMSLEEAVERVKGPRDVDVVVDGTASHGDVIDLLAALFVAGVSWNGESSLVDIAPRSMADVDKIRADKRRTEEWMKLSQAEKEAAMEAAVREAAREAGRTPTDAEIREAARRLVRPVGVSGNARSQYGRPHGRYLKARRWR